MSTRAFFLYTRSNNVAASRRFYSDLVGLDLIWDSVDDIAYGLGDAVQFAIGLLPVALFGDGAARFGGDGRGMKMPRRMVSGGAFVGMVTW